MVPEAKLRPADEFCFGFPVQVRITQKVLHPSTVQECKLDSHVATLTVQLATYDIFLYYKGQWTFWIARRLFRKSADGASIIL